MSIVDSNLIWHNTLLVSNDTGIPIASARVVLKNKVHFEVSDI